MIFMIIIYHELCCLFLYSHIAYKYCYSVRKARQNQTEQSENVQYILKKKSEIN